MRRTYIAILSPKGQITIPATCLRELGWVKGRTRLVRSRVRGGMVVVPMIDGERTASKRGTKP